MGIGIVPMTGLLAMEVDMAAKSHAKNVKGK